MNQNENPVIVIGAGFAGLAAAYEALKLGASVHVLERCARPGGNSIKASSGINGAGTSFQKYQGIPDTFESFYEDTIKSAGRRLNEGHLDRLGLIRMVTEQSAEAIKWLAQEVGIDLSVVAALGGHSIARTHRGSGKIPPGACIVSTLLETLGRNARFKLSTLSEVTALIIEDDEVVGVRYKADSGLQTLHGPVVFTTGGFAGDTHGLIAKHRPDLVGIPSTNDNRPSSHGLLAPLDIEFVDMDSVQVHPTGFVDPDDPFAHYKLLAAEMLRGEGGILLYNGERFVNELETRQVISDAIMKKKTIDNKIRQWDVMILLEHGAYQAAASHIGFYEFKGLCRKVKIKDLEPNIAYAIDKYAAMVSSGHDDLGRKNFGKWKLPPGEANREEYVIVGKVTPVTHFTMGGAAFNTKAQLLRWKNHQLVPMQGLWAAGEVTGGIHGDNRLGGSSLLECAVFGREAGRQAAQSIRHMRIQ
jgi:flavocytochrome c